MHPLTTGPDPVPARTRDETRRHIADRLLTSLEALVRRHRALVLHSEHVELHAELIAAEVSHQLSMTRNALHRHPPLRPGTTPARAAGLPAGTRPDAAAPRAVELRGEPA